MFHRPVRVLARKEEMIALMPTIAIGVHVVTLMESFPSTTAILVGLFIAAETNTSLLIDPAP